MRISRLTTLSLMVVVLLSGVVMAGGWQYSGVGARAKALGGAYRGLSDDGAGAYYNPGGLAFLTTNYFNLTAEFAGPRPEVTPNFNSNGYEFGYLNGQTRYPVKDNVYLMGNTALFFKPKGSDKITFGAALYQMYDHNATMNLFQISDAYNSKRQVMEDNHRSNVDVVTFQPTISYKFSDKLGVGVGIQINRGDLWIDQVGFVDNPYGYPLNVRPYDKFPTITSIDGFGYGIGANIGFQYKPNEKVSFGANFISSSKIKIDGESVERIYFPFNQGIANLYNDPQVNGIPNQAEIRDTYSNGNEWIVLSNFDVDMKLPSEFGAGVAIQANEQTLVSADITYTMWSQFDDFAVVITERDFLGSTNPQASDIWKSLLQAPLYRFNWDDAIRLSLGLERVVNERWTARFGYMYDGSPIPDETFNQIFIDTGNKHHLNIGARFFLNERITFDGAFEAVFAGSREVGEATDADGNGTWDNFGGEWKTKSFNSTWALNYRF